MPRLVSNENIDNEPLEDTTATLPLHSKRTERMQRKQTTRDKKRAGIVNLSKLPTELILHSLKFLRPSDIFSFAIVNRRFHFLVETNASAIGGAIIKRNFPILAQCFPPPKLLCEVEPPVAALLTNRARQQQLNIHKKPYSHIQSPDPQLLCTCLTCILTWNNFGLALDFAYWQDNLDNGEPLPILPRGQKMEWNEKLLARNAKISRKAVTNSLWYALILEMHLNSTVRSIKRHTQNEGNKTKHIEMTEEEASSGTDHFLEKAGPLSLEFPYHRDNYYLLESYLPNRWWKKFEQRWLYTIEGQHERDLERLTLFPRFSILGYHGETHVEGLLKERIDPVYS